MKAASIIAINEILLESKEKEHISYVGLISNLDDKYGQGWTIDNLSAQDKIALNGQRVLYENAKALYEDFCSHQW